MFKNTGSGKKLKGRFLKELQDPSQLSEGVFLVIKNCHIWVSKEEK
jgi:hypothetical protein